MNLENTEIKYLVYDVESIPDGNLIKKIKYPSENITEDEAIIRFQNEQLENSGGKSNFIPVTFQLPICVCVAKIKEDYSIDDLIALDDPDFDTKEMTDQFWTIVEKLYKKASLITFNGRGFDLPIMELMAYRYGISAKRNFTDKFGPRFRFGTQHIDLQDFMTNYNAINMNGGLNLLAKLIGCPGKMDICGSDVYQSYKDGKIKEIRDYCFNDVMDTYFVFLRTRVLMGDITSEQEKDLVKSAKVFLLKKANQIPSLQSYLDNCK